MDSRNPGTIHVGQQTLLMRCANTLILARVRNNKNDFIRKTPKEFF